jgi:hypothetical protein
MSQRPRKSKSSEEGAAHLLPPPPSGFNRKEHKKILNAEHTKQHDEEMRRFRATQHRFIKEQLLADELCHSSKTESRIYKAEDLILLDVVLNGH